MKKTVSLFLVLCLFMSFLFAASAETTAVVRMEYTADWGGEEITGLYTGEMSEGVPAGFGLLEGAPETGKGETGSPWHYIGMWDEGLPSGEGTLYRENGDRETGVWRDGVLYNGTRVTSGKETAVVNGEEASTENAPAASDGGTEPYHGDAAYIGNRNSKKFHDPTCDSVREMKEKNRVEFYSREEAVSFGYTPCSRCQP